MSKETNMSGSLLRLAQRREIRLQLPFCRQFNLVLAADWNPVLPLRNRRRLYAQRSGNFGLCAEILEGLFVGHAPILGAPNQHVKEHLSERDLGLPI